MMFLLRRLRLSQMCLRKGGNSISTASATDHSNVDYYGLSKVDLSKKDFMVNWCKDNVVYEDANIIAINKPPFTPQARRDGRIYTEELVAIQELFPALQKIWNTPELDICLPFQRMHSGVMLLSKNEKSTKRFKQIQQTAKVLKQPFMSHLIITVGIPKFKEPVEETVIVQKSKVERGGKVIQEVNIIPNQSAIGKKEGTEIKVHFKSQILAVNKNLDVAAIQVLCNRTSWHCLEEYLRHKRCLVLGDSFNLNRMKTILGEMIPVQESAGLKEKLEPILAPLGVSTEKSDIVPQHTHRNEVELLQFPHKKSPPLVITAPLPGYFVSTLKKLDLYDDNVP